MRPSAMRRRCSSRVAGAFAALVPILVIGMVVLVIVAIVVGSKRERERREAMRASASTSWRARRPWAACA